MKEVLNKRKMIVIEGNVGVGKSTFLQYLSKYIDGDLLFEPIELWQKKSTDDLLEQFFLKPIRWSYTFQTYILCTLVDQVITEQAKKKDKSFFVERSIFSGKYVFAAAAFEQHWMSEIEKKLYDYMWQREFARNQLIPDGIIYLRAPAQICFERIVKRGRFEEHPITLEYIQLLERLYDAWLSQAQRMDDSMRHVPVLKLDLSGDWIHDLHMQEKLFSQVSAFVKN